jgi:hypothetical protein
MTQMIYKEFQQYLEDFSYHEETDLFSTLRKTKIEYINTAENNHVPRYTNEFWTSKQRQANSIHEISYRACFKPQLPRFFINLLTKPGDIVYDPFAGRGTTIIESALTGRNVISNDINPLNAILSRARLFVPDIANLKKRLDEIPIIEGIESDIDLSMFFHQKTLTEILSLRAYLNPPLSPFQKGDFIDLEEIDGWIRMVATNRLTGHSKGFFSVYTLPPNQAVSPENQRKINEKRDQKPEYRDTKKIILKKTKDLIKNLSPDQIKDNTIQLTVTSPPFLDVVQYADDNWMRCWFNGIDAGEIEKKITMSKKLNDWCAVMSDVFKQLFRITKKDGYVTFEVGEVRGGTIKLDEYVVDIGINQGFVCEGIMINEQSFTKTANIWGIDNNDKGTNSNRIVIFKKFGGKR